MAVVTGSVAVEVVPDATGWERRVRAQVLPDASKLGAEYGKLFGAAATKAIGDSVSVGVERSSRGAERKAPEQGAKVAGKFAEAFKSRLTAALKNLPEAKLGLDLTDAEFGIKRVREQLLALRDKRIGVDISTAEALAELETLRARLAVLGYTSPDVQVKIDAAAAAAELAAFQAEINKVDGRRVEVNVDADTAGAETKLNTLGNGANGGRLRILALTAAIFGLGPALIPIAGVGAAAMASIAIGAIAAAGAVAVLLLALGPIVGAIQAVTQAHRQSSSAASSAASRAIQLANAQDSLKAALKGVKDAQLDAANAAITSSERIADAERARDEAVRTAARNQVEQTRKIADARRALVTAQRRAADQQIASDRNVANAERSLADAQRGVLRAQLDLNAARKQAAQDAEDLANRVIDGKLSEREATIRVADAQRELDNTWVGGGEAAQRQHELALINLEQAKQGLAETQLGNKRLAEQKADSDKKGVEGSDLVSEAQQRLIDAQRQVSDAQQAAADAAKNAADSQADSAQRIADAQQGIVDAVDAAAERQRDDSLKIADAQRSLADAARASAESQRRSADSIAAAQQAVVQAQRGLTQASQATGGAADTAAEKLAKLAPAGREFVTFVDTVLKPKLTELSQAVQQGFLPGLQSGLSALLGGFEGFKGFIASIATEMGTLAEESGTALTSPFWKQFFAFINDTAVPAISVMGHTIGNFATGLAGLLQAFWPVASGFGDGLLGLSKRFADFGKSAGENPAFQGFLKYIRDNGPLVAKTLGDLFGAIGAIVRALAPVGVVVLQVVDAFARLIKALPPQVLAAIVVGIGGIATGILLFRGASAIITGVSLAIKGVGVALEFLSANPIVLVIAAIVALGIAVYEAYQHWTPFREAVDAAWGFIKTASKAAWDFLRPIFAAIGDFIMNTVVPAFVWLWQNVIVPVWDGIKTAIGIAWDVIKAIFGAIEWVIRNLVAPVFHFLLAAAQLVWSLIKTAVEIAWKSIEIVFKAIVLFVQYTLGPIFHWLYDNVIKPVWDKIYKGIKATWEVLIKPIFEALGGFIKDTVAPAFELGVSAIKAAWDKIVDIAKVPVRFVVEQVINKGIIAPFNVVAKAFGVDPVSEITLPSFFQKEGVGAGSTGGTGRVIARAFGGAIPGNLGTPGQDSVPALLMPNEHVWTTGEVSGAGGHAAVERLRAMAAAGLLRG